MGRRLITVVLLALALGALAALPAAGTRSAQARQSVVPGLEASILARLNSVRATHGLAPLRSSSGLSTAARRHTSMMIARGFFSHTSANGVPYWKRIRTHYGPGGSSQWAVGENLLWASPTITANRAVQIWMESPGHRRNILDPRWREIGVAVISTPRGRGAFGSGAAMVITTDFGFRR